MTVNKKLKSGTDVLVLDFSDSMNVPCDGDADVIGAMIDKATKDAIAGIPESYGATAYDFPMAYNVASGACEPLTVTVKSPVRQAIGTDVSVEDAGKMLEGYVKCDKLYQQFRMSDEMVRANIMNGVLIGSIRSRIPSISDASANAIINHVRTNHSARTDIVNAVEAECSLIVRVAFGDDKYDADTVVPSTTGGQASVPKKATTRKSTPRKRVRKNGANASGKAAQPTNDSVAEV